MIDAPTATTSTRPPIDKVARDLREVVNGVVGSVFLEPMMRTQRSSVLQGEVGHGGRGEQVFQAQLDNALIERSSASPQFPVSEALYDRLIEAARRRQSV